MNDGEEYWRTERRRARKRQSTYGVSTVEQTVMLMAQEDRCACCGDELHPGRATHLDHDHATGRVRGFLCGSCNHDPERARKLVAYLERHQGATRAGAAIHEVKRMLRGRR